MIQTPFPYSFNEVSTRSICALAVEIRLVSSRGGTVLVRTDRMGYMDRLSPVRMRQGEM